MYRFTALLWDTQDPQAATEASHLAARARTLFPDWLCLIRSNGLLLFAPSKTRDGLHPYVLSHESGVILGRLFHSKVDYSATRPDITFDEQTTALILASQGRRLISDYWGCYLAFLHDQANHRCHIIRDCSGRLPCFRFRCGRVQVLFADLSDALPLMPAPIQVNWRYIAAFLFYDDLRIRDSGISGITELLAGESLTVDRSGETLSFVWDPEQIAAGDVIDDYSRACAELERTVQQSIDAWSTVHRNVLQRLSGGFDSAVVLGCANRSTARPRITCINRYAERPAEDERSYARAAAALAHTPLIERSWYGRDIPLREILNGMPLLTKPMVQSLGWQDTELHNQLAIDVEAEATWTGEGGDHLFFQMKTPLIAADYVRRHGLGRNLAQVISDVATLTTEPYLIVLRHAFQSPKRSQAPHTVSDRLSFVNKAAVFSDVHEYIASPWSQGTENLPPAKRLQIKELGNLLNRTAPHTGVEIAREHHPLISQPIIELCLRIPTYLLIRGGRSRALAKQAFRDVVPSVILDRDSKGCTTSYLINLIRQNVDLVRELLLDGDLVREGLLDRAALRTHLELDQPLRQTQLLPLLACISAESWVRTWRGGGLSHTSRAIA